MALKLYRKNDIKVFILFLLRNVGRPLDFTTVNDIVVQDEVVGYFDFAENFAELLETGNIAELRGPDGSRYQVTEQGIEVAEHLQSDILAQIREKSLQSALRLLSFQARGAKVHCDIEDLPKGCYLHCGITEPKADPIHVQLYVETRQQAERMRHQFLSRPEILYRGILALLNGEMSYLLD